MTGLAVSSFLQSKLKRYEGPCLELLHAVGRFELTFIAAHQASKMLCDVGLLKSRIKTPSFLDDIITSSNEVFIDWESDMVEGIWMLREFSWQTDEGYIIVE